MGLGTAELASGADNVGVPDAAGAGGVDPHEHSSSAVADPAMMAATRRITSG
jgi:hypothetical protein